MFVKLFGRNPLNRIRILLVDRNTEFLNAAEHFLALEPELEVVGRLPCCRDALQHIEQLQPDIVVAELILAGANNQEAMSHVKALPQPPLLVMLTSDDEPEYHIFAQSLGADGCVNKAEFGEQFLPLIRKLCA